MDSEVNLFAVIGAKQVQIELLQNQVKILSEGYKQLSEENAGLKAKLNPPEEKSDEEELTNSNGNKENAADILAGTDKPL